MSLSWIANPSTIADRSMGFCFATNPSAATSVAGGDKGDFLHVGGRHSNRIHAVAARAEMFDRAYYRWLNWLRSHHHSLEGT
jgi:hypothetical protein